MMETNADVVRELERIMRSGFTGEIQLHVQKGTVQHVKKVETFRPRDLKADEPVRIREG